jgi:hypothetical protein
LGEGRLQVQGRTEEETEAPEGAQGEGVSIGKLVGSAMRPGVSLKHESHRLMPVDILQALAMTPATAATLIQARRGADNLPQLRSAVKRVAMTVFADRGWQIPEHRAIGAATRMDMFVEQCWREYMGAPCGRCKGHGFVGPKYEALRHRLAECKSCEGAGFTIIPFQWTEATSYQWVGPRGMRQVCPTCRGRCLVEISEAVRAGKLSVCMACWGSGSVPASTRRRARALRYDHMHVYRVWQERFRIVLATLRAHERDGLIVCREALFGAPT